MPRSFPNPHRHTVLDVDAPLPLTDPAPVEALLRLCPAHAGTPLLDLPDLARHLGVEQVLVKDERGRMGLGSFKALGAAYAIARQAAEAVSDQDWGRALTDATFATASAGNHGLSVAAGALVFGARAVIYLAETVPEPFADRLREKGAEVVRAGQTYEASMSAAEEDAQRNGWVLLSDSSWDGYTDLPARVMEGYLQMAAEACAQTETPPTHILLQAGVGGMAAAVAAYCRQTWGDGPKILVIEPEAAPALMESARAGHPVTTQGPVSAMGRLDCKTPSLIAFRGLASDADVFVTISEEEAQTGVATLASYGLDTTPSGGAGLAALLAGLDLPSEARVLTFLSEGPEVLPT